MALVETIITWFKQTPTDRLVERARRQPLMKEIWLAEDAALKAIFDGFNDTKINSSIERISADFQGKLKKVPCGQEKLNEELCKRNARRMVWDTQFDIEDETRGEKNRLMEEELRRLNVYDQFQKEYVVDGKSKLVTTYPDKPYFD